MSEEKKLHIIFRVEPGCLGPQGDTHVEKFCEFAQQEFNTIDPELIHWDIIPRFDKSLDEINKTVAKLVGVDEVMYNSLEGIRDVAGDGSFQALDASYPIAEKYWPDWIKTEVERFNKYR